MGMRASATAPSSAGISRLHQQQQLSQVSSPAVAVSAPTTSAPSNHHQLATTGSVGTRLNTSA